MARIYVTKEAKPHQQRGDWTVRLGSPTRGERIDSHRQRSAAIKRARRAGRVREDQGATVYVPSASGSYRKLAEYGGGH